MREKIIEAVLEHKLVAIVRGLEEAKVVPLAKALGDGGINRR